LHLKSRIIAVNSLGRSEETSSPYSPVLFSSSLEINEKNRVLGDLPAFDLRIGSISTEALFHQDPWILSSVQAFSKILPISLFMVTQARSKQAPPLKGWY